MWKEEPGGLNPALPIPTARDQVEGSQAWARSLPICSD
jgi:hypothetical protein